MSAYKREQMVSEIMYLYEKNKKRHDDFYLGLRKIIEKVYKELEVKIDKEKFEYLCSKYAIVEKQKTEMGYVFPRNILLEFITKQIKNNINPFSIPNE